MNDLRARVGKLEKHFGIAPTAPPPEDYECDPEWVIVWPDLEALLHEHLKATGQPATFTPDAQGRHAFFAALGHALDPHPELKAKVGAILERVVAANDARVRQHAGR